MSKEVVVMGGGVGGLSAAIYARLAGHNVLLLEASDSVGGKASEIKIGGYRLDPGPSIIILPRVYRQLFQDANRELDDYLRFQRLDPISRVYSDGREPLDLPADREKCEALVDRVNPEDGKNFRRMMSQLDKVMPLVDRSIFAHPIDNPMQLLNRNLLQMGLNLDVRQPYKGLVDSWFQSPLLRAFFYGFPSYGGQTYDSKAPGALLIPYLMIQEGVYYPEGGVSAIPKAMCKLALELGVEILTNKKVNRLESKGKSVASATLEDGTKVEAEVFISGVDRLTTRSWLDHPSDLSPSFSYFTVHWGVRRKLKGLKHHTLLIPKGFESGLESLYRQRKFPNPPIVYLNETSAIDASAAPAGCSNLFAVVTSPAMEEHLDWAREAARAKAAVLDVMSQYGFTLSESELDFERIQTPPYFEKQHGSYRGSLYGPDERHRLFGMFPLRNRDEQYRNLLYAGGSVQPGAGLPMVTLSGKFAAAKI